MRNFPLIKFLFVFSVSISVGIYFELHQKIFYYLFFFSLIGLAFYELTVSNRKKYKRALSELLIVLSIFFSGLTVVIIQTDQLKNNFIGKYIEDNNMILDQLIVEIVKPIKLTSKKVSVTANVKAIQYRGQSIQTGGKSIFYLNKDSLSAKLLPGDILEFKNIQFKNLTYHNNPGQFDYATFLRFHQIHYANYINEWDKKGSTFNFLRYPTLIRNKALEVLKANVIIKSHFPIVSALVLGYKDELSNHTKHSFSSTGAMHVLAVSGLHVGIIYFILKSIITLFTFYQRNLVFRNILLLIGIWIYALITGMSPSVLRACTMLSFLIIAEVFNRNTNVYNVLSASAILLLIINPYLIMQVGFQLSYLAVLGILYIQPKMEKIWAPKYWLIQKIWTITTVSIAAQISTFPLGLLYFHQFPNYFLISNLVVIPAAFLILSLGILIIVLSFSKIIVGFISYLLQHVLNSLLLVIRHIESIPGSLTEGLSISIFETMLIYLFIASILSSLKLKKFIFYGISTFIFFLLLLINGIEDYRLKGLKRIIVYNIPNHFGMDLVNGPNHYFIGDSALIQNDEKLLFYVKHNWHELDLKSPTFIHYDTLTSSFFNWGGVSINLFNKNIERNHDISILKNYSRVIDQNIKASQLVTIESNYDYSINDDHLIHSIVDQGAFIKDFN
tara:strand:- start:2206 stop:4221 length:2016 start_codon:yes stop_codon:yes gene_type:complete